ncbi:hypothetical protein S7711_00055 [Stachybotrys chartarum IBT 7711]|uniref:Cytochrome P450 n=1 Tax=Stachybotrys chartarum (strain CBS 109288 / IBT 7711) TaxID=1280523 RepID=A0A084B3A8_STACB|nr:hypothetical protein S7711_00055 [Stachybotrys chartarum IBT 7711]KFA52259.1 hypothetical protein S40293_00452 [Stachybotrys chartarum IBT 40293]KFA74629.1 hypothetical protein S40288_05827 [Stachybotrys chartarum IBT 40288]
MAWTAHVPLLLCLVVVCFCARKLYRRITDADRNDAFWASVPTVGVPTTGLLPWTRAALYAITGTSRTALEGYGRFCKNNNLFALPSTGAGAVVAIPPSLLSLLNRSESQVRAFDCQIENIQPHYMIGDRGLYENILHFEVVRKHMTKDVGYFAASTAEELHVAFSDVWGTKTGEWTEIPVFDTCARIIARASNRAFLGLPLCRDETLLEQTRLYANAVYLGSAIITALPQAMRPLLGHLIALPAKRYLAKCQEILVPFIQDRLKLWRERKASEQPNDAVQWMIERCSKFDAGEMEPTRIAQRLLILNLVSIFTTAYAFANCVLDLYGSEHRDDFVAGLRAEYYSVVQNHGAPTTKAAVDRLYRLDSTVRESLRLSAFGIITLQRIVGDSGLDLGDGIHIPGGVRIGIPSQAIHFDASYHENPLAFDAFRFSRPFEGPEGQRRQSSDQRLSVNIDESFLTYGYGKHACPGRWFASQLMKQALAYMLHHYDVELVGKRPEKKAVLNMILPPLDARIRIRRRT